jgi:hypothetical protein
LLAGSAHTIFCVGAREAARSQHHPGRLIALHYGLAAVK